MHGQFHSRVDYHKKVPGSMLFENFSTITEIRALNKVSTSLSPQLRQTFLISSNMPTVIKFAGHLMNIFPLLARRQLLATCAVVCESWGSVLRCPHPARHFTASHPLHMNSHVAGSTHSPHDLCQLQLDLLQPPGLPVMLQAEQDHWDAKYILK